MPFKIDRVDTSDSFYTLFIVESDKNEFQEFRVPIWDADEFEAKISGFTNIDMQTFKEKVGKKNARPNQ